MEYHLGFSKSVHLSWLCLCITFLTGVFKLGRFLSSEKHLGLAGRPAGVKDYRPVALTSVTMMTFERLLLQLLKPQLQQALDPLQFTY